MEEPIWISCGECEFGTEDLKEMEQHLFNAHDYLADDAVTYAQLWQENAYEQQELENIERAEEFRRTGHDPFEEWDDHHPGK